MNQAAISGRTPAVFPEGVSQPAIRTLASAGFIRWEELAGVSEAELLKLHGLGLKAIRLIQQALREAELPPIRP